MKRIDDIIEEIIAAEGGYSDDPSDAGGKTNYGITEEVARENGYTGGMRDLPINTARQIYLKRYVIEPGFDKVLTLAPLVAAELVDTGVNCGQPTAAKFFQRALNAFNQRATLWPDLTVDGHIGDKSIEAFAAYLRNRGQQEGERVMLVAINALQGAHYIDLSQAGEMKNEKFVYGWMLNRVSAQV